MTIFTVTTAADVVDAGDGVLSLREAARQANATAAADTIRFAAPLEGRTLTLTGGELALDADVAVDGDRNDDGTRVTLDGNDNGRVLAVGGSGTDVVLDDLVITGGRATGGDNGGGILLGRGCGLAMTQCTVRDNTTTFGAYDFGDGGGIFAQADSRLSITESIVSSNSGAYGGGVAVVDGSSLELTRSLVEGNSAGGGRGISDGGGISGSGSFIRLTSSTVAGNSASDIPSSARAGGILAAGGTLELNSCTVTGNSATQVYAFDTKGGGVAVSEETVFRIANSVVLGNFGIINDTTYRADLLGAIDHTNGHNLLGSGGYSRAGDRAGFPEEVFAAIDPTTGGGQLARNGGPTPTVALLNSAGNLALSGGEPVAAPGVDQRGVARPLPGTSNPDIGAFELNQGAVSTTPSNRNDVLTGTPAAETIDGGFGADLILGQGGNDRLSGGRDSVGDTLRGGFGSDTLDGGPGLDTASYRDATGGVVVSLATGRSSGALGSDTLISIENLEGGSGGDRLTGDGLANELGGREGNDRLAGLTGGDQLLGDGGEDLLEPGFGDDWLDGGTGIDKVSYLDDGGPLAVTADLARGVATRSGEIDRLRGVENAEGTRNPDLLLGDEGANALGGAGGADRLFGRDGGDRLLGGSGNDRLFGALGRDVQTGGAGADLFDFDRLADSRVGTGRDVITDFAHLSDRIDLATIDARAGTAANEAFVFRAAEGAAFTGAGQVRWFQSGGDTFVEANVDADLRADLQIELTGLKAVGQADFVL